MVTPSAFLTSMSWALATNGSKIIASKSNCFFILVFVLNNKGCICCKGAIHEFVVIMVFFNQVKTEIGVDQFYILTFEQQMNDDSLCRALSFSYQAWLYGVRRCSCRMASFFLLSHLPSSQRRSISSSTRR